MLKWMQAKAKGKKGEVHLYGDIGEWFGGPSTSSFSEELAVVGDVDELDIYVNSPGGSIVDGMGIYNILARHKAKKIVHIDYLAASIASVIAMVGDEIRIAGNGRMMIHRAFGCSCGNPDEIIASAEALRGMEEDIVKTYAARTKHKPEKIREMLAAETWMSADQCKELGFCDAVEPLKTANKIESALLNHYKNLPSDLRPNARAGMRSRIAEMGLDVAQLRRTSPATA